MIEEEGEPDRTRLTLVFEKVAHIEIDVLSLDNDLGDGEAEGYTILDWMEEQFFEDESFRKDWVSIHFLRALHCSPASCCHWAKYFSANFRIPIQFR